MKPSWFIAAATSFNGRFKSPGLAGKNPEEQVKSILASASEKNYKELRSRHIDDYRKIFNRVELSLEQAEIINCLLIQELRIIPGNLTRPWWNFCFSMGVTC